jgi:hypothetical protein
VIDLSLECEMAYLVSSSRGERGRGVRVARGEAREALHCDSPHGALGDGAPSGVRLQKKNDCAASLSWLPAASIPLAATEPKRRGKP